jgi:hypothetical protein
MPNSATESEDQLISFASKGIANVLDEFHLTVGQATRAMAAVLIWAALISKVPLEGATEVMKEALEAEATRRRFE